MIMCLWQTGTACVQLAREADLHVIATAGTEEEQEIVKAQGADVTYNHRAKGYIEQIKVHTSQCSPYSQLQRTSIDILER